VAIVKIKKIAAEQIAVDQAGVAALRIDAENIANRDIR
jgi:hypothetical protein